MRIGEATSPVLVRGVTFHVSLSWGELKRFLSEWESLAGGGDSQAASEFIETRMCKAVRRIEGLDDECGQPIEQMTPEVVDLLPADMIVQFFAALAQIGSGAPDPLAIPTAASAP